MVVTQEGLEPPTPSSEDWNGRVYRRLPLSPDPVPMRNNDTVDLPLSHVVSRICGKTVVVLQFGPAQWVAAVTRTYLSPRSFRS